MGPPQNVFCHSGGSGTVKEPLNASRSASSITCCVPTLRAMSFPSRIQRRTVSGLRPTRRAASGTVSMRALLVVACYNTGDGATSCALERHSGAKDGDVVGVEGAIARHHDRVEAQRLAQDHPV